MSEKVTAALVSIEAALTATLAAVIAAKDQGADRVAALGRADEHLRSARRELEGANTRD